MEGIGKDYKVTRMKFFHGRVLNLGNYESARFEEELEIEVLKDCTEEELVAFRKEIMTHLKKQIKTEIKKQLREPVE